MRHEQSHLHLSISIFIGLNLPVVILCWKSAILSVPLFVLQLTTFPRYWYVMLVTLSPFASVLYVYTVRKIDVPDRQIFRSLSTLPTDKQQQRNEVQPKGNLQCENRTNC